MKFYWNPQLCKWIIAIYFVWRFITTWHPWNNGFRVGFASEWKDYNLLQRYWIIKRSFFEKLYSISNGDSSMLLAKRRYPWEVSGVNTLTLFGCLAKESKDLVAFNATDLSVSLSPQSVMWATLFLPLSLCAVHACVCLSDRHRETPRTHAHTYSTHNHTHLLAVLYNTVEHARYTQPSSDFSF